MNQDLISRAVAEVLRIGGVAAGVLLAPALAMGQSADHSAELPYKGVDGLLEAVEYYRQYATSDFPHILEATRRFEDLAAAHPTEDEHPDGWLPAYWTAFAYTQLALFARDERQQPFADLAEVYYDKAWAARPTDEARIEADFYALKGLILGRRAAAYPEKAQALGAEGRGYWDRALEADPDNPMAMMNWGLNLLPNMETRARAYELLDRTIELYEPRMGSVEPAWGREFIDVWMGNYPRPNGDWDMKRWSGG